MSSCLGFRKSKGEDTEALLPQYDDDTQMQRSLHQKLHTYEMLRAMQSGFMPSTEQVIINLRTLLASDLLSNSRDQDLSDDGMRLQKFTKQWLKQFIETLRHKNDDDQIQDFIWYLSKSKISVDTEALAETASKVKAKADANAAYESLRTVASLLLTNSDFRIFVSDLGVIARQVFSDTAFSLSAAAEQTGKQLQPGTEETKAIQHPGADNGTPPDATKLKKEAANVAETVQSGLKKIEGDAVTSLQENVSGEQRDTLIYRLKQAITKLRKRNDYSDSVSTISRLIQRYAAAYSRAADETVNAAQDNVESNEEFKRAVDNLWSLVGSFGDRKAWEKLRHKCEKVLQHSQRDPDLEKFMSEVGNAVQKLLSEPDFFDSAEEKMQDLKTRAKDLGNDSSLREDIDAALSQFQITFNSVVEDEDISALINTSTKIFDIVSPENALANTDLFDDFLHNFIPLAIQLIQYVPIPRLEVSVPEIDLLLENLIIEPGRTVRNTSFFPYQPRFETQNDLELRKSHPRKTVSTLTSLLTISVQGLSVRADEVGFWLRAHKGILRLADEGIISFALDERGMDIALDVEIGRNKLEKILSLRAVRVHIHKLSYQLRRSKISWLAWLVKPLLQPILRRVLERQIASSIAEGLRAANRELLFARERLRATRVADPQDLLTFVKAVAARLTPEDDPDVYTAVGVRPSKGVFRGVYAPGSVVKMWEEEARDADDKIEEAGYVPGGWRNEIFDVQSAASMGVS